MEGGMVKILHTGDLHLDAPFSLYDVRKAQARKNELRGVFSSIVFYAKTEKVDMVIISGDFFDHGFVTKETLEHINGQFESAPACKFVIAPGNHDCADPKSPYKKAVFPPNVYIFGSEELSKFEFSDIGVDVYGWAFTSPEMEKCPIEHYVKVNPERINILACHGDMLTKNSRSCPLTTDDIARSNCDYAALGHIHAGTEAKRAGNTYYAYCGCPEGRSFDECGTKGAIICTFERQSGGFLKTDFIYKRFCRRKYEKLTVDITGAGSRSEVISAIKTAMTKKSVGADTLLRVTLTGAVSPVAELKTDRITDGDIGVFYLELRDETSPVLSADILRDDLSIKGAFYRELLPKLESDDPEERRAASMALKYGLAALSGSDVVDF